MTSQTISLGWFIIAASLVVLGALVIHFAAQDWFDRRAVRKAHRIVTEHPADAQARWERHVADGLALAEQAATRRPLRAVPPQRDGGAL